MSMDRWSNWLDRGCLPCSRTGPAVSCSVLILLSEIIILVLAEIRKSFRKRKEDGEVKGIVGGDASIKEGLQNTNKRHELMDKVT